MRRLACKTVFVDRIQAEGLQPSLDRTDFKIGCCMAITSLHFSRVRGRCHVISTVQEDARGESMQGMPKVSLQEREKSVGRVLVSGPDILR